MFAIAAEGQSGLPLTAAVKKHFISAERQALRYIL